MRVWLVALVFVSVAMAGCGDKKEGPGGEPYVTPSKDDDGGYAITIKSDNTISPRNAKVPEGAKVVWTAEVTGCRIKADDGAFDSANGGISGGSQFNNGNVPKGETYTWSAITPGEHEYGCSGKSIRGSLKVS